jgi:hypothetical protein
MNRLLLLTAAVAVSAFAAEPDLTPPAEWKKLQRGLWEQTLEDERTPPPPMDPEVVTRGLDPEAKKRVLATLEKQKARGPGPTTTKHTKKFCVNDEWMAKRGLGNMSEGLDECKAQVISRSASKASYKVECPMPEGHSVIELNLEVKSATEVAMTASSQGTIQGHELKSHSTYTAHFVTVDCAGTK